MRAADRLRNDGKTGAEIAHELGTTKPRVRRMLAAMVGAAPTHGPLAPDGSKPGTWNEVGAASLSRMLSEDQYARGHAAVEPPEGT